MSVVGIVLAAGRGARMGSPKQLLELDGRPLLQHVIDAAAAAPLEGVIVVLGHEAERVAAALDLPAGVVVVANPRHRDGQSTSLRAGLGHAPGAPPPPSSCSATSRRCGPTRSRRWWRPTR